MRREELYREIGQIDEALIEAAEQSGARGRSRRGRFSKKWIAVVACLIVYSSTATALLATEYTKNKAAEPYIRYLTAEDMELAPVCSMRRTNSCRRYPAATMSMSTLP